ncbi:cysteine desulfurase-like protein [Brevibacillus sp. 179-C9.3 HS]|uniref:cysteine desulfurase-like protein n=1 Tax=unclassified Brevibacillus TaxID=2684853 RepID=UPI0039A2A785
MSTTINTALVRIQPWTEDDLSLLRLLNAPDMMEHLGGPETEEQLLVRHKRYVNRDGQLTGKMFSIVLLPDQIRVGSIGYWDRVWQGENVYEVGWSVLPPFQGKGIASAALSSVVTLINKERRHKFIHAYPSVDNPASNAICRKLGFSLQAECVFEYPPGHFMHSNDWRLEVSTERFPIQAVREQFPALQRTYNGKQVVYLDGPGGSQVVKASMDAIYSYMANGGANLHGSFPTSKETETILADAKQAVADLFQAKPQEVAFGANMTTLTFAIARALGRHWKEGDELIVSELDHRANVDPWLTVAADRGMTVRWLKVNRETLTLQIDELDTLLTSRTKLIAVGLASNAIGTINDLAAISHKARAKGVIVAVDAVHAVPHLSIHRDEIGADILLCSAYKFFGPHVGIAVIRKEIFEALDVYKLVPAPASYPDKLETGTQNHEGIAGIRPAIELIASLGSGDTFIEQIRSGYEAIEAYENQLAEKLRKALGGMKGVTLYQAKDDVAKTPTIAFRIEGFTPQQVCEQLCEKHSIFVADGDFYATTLANCLGIHDSGGWIRAGLAPYNTNEEIERLVEGIKEIVGE